MAEWNLTRRPAVLFGSALALLTPPRALNTPLSLNAGVCPDGYCPSHALFRPSAMSGGGRVSLLGL